MSIRSLLRAAALLATLVLAAACGEPAEPVDDSPTDESVESLSDLDALFEGAPDNDSIPQDGKFDAVYPPQFDVTSTLTPVRSQGRRGTCSIFATAALMEQLYTVEGSVPNPDFSEQFLQWSTKVELGIFQTTAGSNAGRNLDAIHRFGIVTEETYPYEDAQWGTAQDPECTGDDMPTRCYTNGDPAEDVLAQQRYDLPPGRYVNCRDNSIKAYMTEKQVGVIASLTFFYQSWNHRRSTLPVNDAYSRAGYVLYPNEEDIEISEEKRAGHAILLVGWDDELEVPIVDAEGNEVIGEDGEPVVERGFFLFKNSWGTTRFGTENPFGAGYGWISQRYVSRYGSCYSSSVPTIEPSAEICDNGGDDNRDGVADCDDPTCAEHEACRPIGTRFEAEPNIAIPDNDQAGVTSTVDVPLEGVVEQAVVTVAITHTYRGDLQVDLVAPNGTIATLHSRAGASEDDLLDTFYANEVQGVPVTGEWALVVRDLGAADTGTLVSWSVEFTLGGELAVEDCANGVDDNGDGAADCADASCIDQSDCQTAESIELDGEYDLPIPDGDPAGVDSIIESAVVGTLASLSVSVDITHPYRGDLTLYLEHESGVKVTLFDRDGDDEDDLVRTFQVPEFVGTYASGYWLLNVADHAIFDEGTLNSWTLEMVVQ